ncbi:endo-1,3-1,4-beta-glycanase ExoK [Deinobacterium chartae]|uniref:Endo-1,3-1,4-beta-glycanase ExoK n=1 Tax=Deinobacterium chartae TaxID=521158 RepID=A0A841HXY1_9DEIO|nr:glycoside hydrolase family 16 protein [Deinobacterium chartae]MBB6096655.1 endo-1,3-1,4-beta-glycanase ExoK [Deinobacterium chartae]
MKPTVISALRWPVLAAALTAFSVACAGTDVSASVDTAELEIAGITATTPPTFFDDFTQLDTSRWEISNGDWPAFWKTSTLTGNFNRSKVFTNGKGHLVLELNVQRCDSGYCAQGAELVTRERFGYGRYEVRMRAASTSAQPQKAGLPRTGNVSAAFSYWQDSTTEIDVEIEGNRPRTAWVGAWKGLDLHQAQPAQSGHDKTQVFHVYRWDWLPGSLRFYIDGRLQYAINRDIPVEKAHLMLNLWPTNSDGWGGKAAEQKTYMLVDYVRFTAAKI